MTSALMIRLRKAKKNSANKILKEVSQNSIIIKSSGLIINTKNSKDID